MIDRARHLIQRMVNNIISVSEKFNRNICKHTLYCYFLTVDDRQSSPPDSTNGEQHNLSEWEV